MKDIQIVEILDRNNIAIAKRLLLGDMILVNLNSNEIYCESKFKHILMSCYFKLYKLNIKKDKYLMDNLENFTLEELRQLGNI